MSEVSKNAIPIIDLFAGPGGLGEGFAEYPFHQRYRAFQIGLSIEKDSVAVQTLRLRSFVRKFPKKKLPDEYYELLSDWSEPLDIRLQNLESRYANQFRDANREAWCAELGKTNELELDQRIRSATGGHKNWVLIGGPPCQAYSLAGRSRNKGKEDYIADDDSRQFLYKEYLKVIANYHPAVFVMENVKGLLSATVKNQKIFGQILSDLRNPQSVFPIGRDASSKDEYQIFSVAQNTESESVGDFIVKMEDYGVPQARHRVILLGVRRDIAKRATPDQLEKQEVAKTSQAISGLPRLRSGLSRTPPDSIERWIEKLNSIQKSDWVKRFARNGDVAIYDSLVKVTSSLRKPRHDRGGEFVRSRTLVPPTELGKWLEDKRLGGAFNHATRGHMRMDLDRYLFAACFARIKKRSPALKEFP